MIAAWRLLLFVPANEPERIAKASITDADAVILDLEDGVPAHAKDQARIDIPAAVDLLRQSGKDVIIRLNAPWHLATHDLAAAVAAKVDTVMVPKAETEARISTISEMLDEFESLAGVTIGHISVIALIETAIGVANALRIGNSSRVVALAMGSEDLSANLGAPPTIELLDLPCRQIILAAAAARVASFATPVSIAAFRDEDATRRAAEKARSLGGQGALCVHPLQVAIVNQTFTPSLKELDEALAIVSNWAEAQTVGRAVTTLNGRMIDAPVAERAAKVLAIANRTNRYRLS